MELPETAILVIWAPIKSETQYEAREKFEIFCCKFDNWTEPLIIGKKTPYASSVGKFSGGSACELTNIFKSVSLNPIVDEVGLLTLTVNTSYTFPDGRANLNPGSIEYALYTSGLAYSVAQSIIVVYDVSNFQECEVITYNSSTGALQFRLAVVSYYIN